MQVAFAPTCSYSLVSLWLFICADFSQIALETRDYLYNLLQKLILTNFYFEWMKCLRA